MSVLIAQPNKSIGNIWAAFLKRGGADVTLVTNQKEAIKKIKSCVFDTLVLEMILPDGGAIAIADFAAYKSPSTAIITVNSSSFFSDGSIFQLMPNVSTIMQGPLNVGDLAAVISYVESK